jgi:inositol 1,4,5-triphosphate receptor type 1/inositol 1,4,5-triphosphate receptor type 3
MNVEVVYYLTYGVLAFIATIVHPFFFAFHLTEFLIRYPTLRNILRSVWEPKKSLLLTFVLVILFLYFFTIVAYMIFSSYYDGKCENVYMCLFETFDRTFKNNGGIGGWFSGSHP